MHVCMQKWMHVPGFFFIPFVFPDNVVHRVFMSLKRIKHNLSLPTMKKEKEKSFLLAIRIAAIHIRPRKLSQLNTFQPLYWFSSVMSAFLKTSLWQYKVGKYDTAAFMVIVAEAVCPCSRYCSITGALEQAAWRSLLPTCSSV